MTGDDLAPAPSRPPEVFGRLGDGRTIERHWLSDDTIKVAVLTWGATVQSLFVPDRDGQVADVALGFDGLDSYLDHTAYFGATIGRFANRVAGGRFTLGGEVYRIPANHHDNALHGGPEGFDRQVWEAQPFDADGGPALRLSRVSPDGEMGFPGTLTVSVTYILQAGQLRMSYEATTDRSTVVNLTNHTYFNLTGAGPGSGTVEDHRLEIAAGRYVPVDHEGIPLGPIDPVDGTPMDFRTAKPIGRDLRAGTDQLRMSGGFDHNWALDRDPSSPLSRAAVASEPSTGRVLEVWTDQPGVQFYSGNFLDATLIGKGGRAYRQGDGFCLETQHFPDSPNRPDYPSTVLRPGERFASATVWRFDTT